MADRPDFIKCVLMTPGNQRLGAPPVTWCSRKLYGFSEWLFQSLDHAAHNGLADSRLIVCPACLASAVAALSRGQDTMPKLAEGGEGGR